MRRKIIKQSMGGRTVFLPIKWVRENNLEPGDDVDIIIEGNELIIRGRGQEPRKSREISLLSADNLAHVRSLIASAYKAGYTEISINFQEKIQFHEIDSIVNTFTGLEVVSQESNAVRVCSFLKTNESETYNLIVKMFQIINTICISIIDEWDSLDLENLKSMKKNAIRLRDHCLRIIHTRKLGGDYSYDYYDLITQLEKIASDFYFIGEYISVSGEADKDLFVYLVDRFRELNDCYMKKDFEFTNAVWQKHLGELKDRFSPGKLGNFVKKNDGALAVYCYHLMERYLHVGSRLLTLSE